MKLWTDRKISVYQTVVETCGLFLEFFSFYNLDILLINIVQSITSTLKQVRWYSPNVTVIQLHMLRLSANSDGIYVYLVLMEIRFMTLLPFSHITSYFCPRFFLSHINKSHLGFKTYYSTIHLQLSVVEIQESQPMAWDMVMIMLLDKMLLTCANLDTQWNQIAP